MQLDTIWNLDVKSTNYVFAMAVPDFETNAFMFLFSPSSLVKGGSTMTLQANGSSDNVASVPVNSALTLTCTVPVNALSSNYYRTHTGADVFMVLQIAPGSGDTCLEHPSYKIPSYMSCSCMDAPVYSCTLRSVTSAMDGDRWTCSHGNGLDRSNSVQLHVQGGLPQATIKWFKVTGDTCYQSGMEITSLGSDPFVSDVDGLKQVESTLTFTGARTDNGQRICCTANAPSSPPAIRGYANGSTYSMIENSTESLTCSSKGGKPLATLTWKCFNNQMSDPTEQDHTVTRVVQWTARHPPSTPLFRVANVHVGSSIKIVRDSTQTVECYSSGNPAPTSSNFTWRRGSTAFGRSPVLKWPGGVKVVDEGSYTCTVETTLTPTNQNPPGLPTIHLDSSSGPVIDGPLTLVVQRPFTLACNAFSKPPGSYTWTGGVNVVQGQLIQDTLTTKVNTSRMCTASNPPESVNIRHESVSGTIINSELRVIEGDATKLYCSVQSQPASSYSWSGVGIHSLGNTMVYSNTRPKQTGVLSCLVENNMTHLIQAVKGLASRNISLNVLYPPKLRVLHRLNSVEGNNTSISIFDFIAFPNQYIVTIKESDRLVLLCGVFSNPNSTIRLKQKHMATIIMERENVREVVYVIQNVSCSDAAVYTCSAFNNYTDVERAPSKELQLLAPQGHLIVMHI
ncbi:HMCN1-like protein [Mya arenaria]|uniref:HMCN1-like protein n=1 Tax=Mya arenaria TaxID=6604 RepID=A0ABY7EAX0_MYAAR|nr:HMCN1-like protein [Mya arenaria]